VSLPSARIFDGRSSGPHDRVVAAGEEGLFSILATWRGCASSKTLGLVRGRKEWWRFDPENKCKSCSRN